MIKTRQIPAMHVIASAIAILKTNQLEGMSRITLLNKITRITPIFSIKPTDPRKL
jgi:hypothetical protein